MEGRTFGVIDDLEVAMIEDEEDWGECDCSCHKNEFDDSDENEGNELAR